MKKTISIIMIILMVILVSGKCFATDGALDLTNTLETPGSTNDDVVDLNPPTNTNTPNVTEDENLPKAGVADTTAFIVIGIACVAIGIYAFKKMRYYTDV